jgi:hypothetical protein
MLRHDWGWPASAAAFEDFVLRSTSGWDIRGMGAPNLYLDNYLVGIAIWLMLQVLGSHLALWAFAYCVGLACALGAARLADELGAGPIARVGLSLIATFNPFVYTETVAGHLYLLLALGATMALLAEAGRRAPRPIVAALLVALTLMQLQFFLPALAIALVVGLRSRRWSPLVTGIVVGAPVLLAVALEYPFFRSVPQTLAWEIFQSVPLAQAAVLNGYFTHYGKEIHRLASWPMWTLVALAAVGCAVAWRSATAKIVAAGSILSLATAAGLCGPLGSALAWSFIHVPPAALYRELYDIVGFTAVSYLAGAALAAARFRIAGAIVLAAGLMLAWMWFAYPPSQWWVAAELLPSVRADLPAGTRLALVPAFQPLNFRGSGSGLDPDAYVRRGAAPLNTLSPSYPAVAALARYVANGETKSLAALGVGEIISRPWLTSEGAALKEKPNNAVASANSPVQATLNAQPLVGLLPTPLIGSVDDVLGAGAVFFADAAGLQGEGVPPSWSAYRAVIPIEPPRTYVNAEDGWIDARLTFEGSPQLAQALGGAMTTSPSALLPIDARAQALVFVSGTLVGQDGRLVTRGTRGYRWIWIPAGVNAVRCLGLCVVAAQGFAPAGLPSTPPPASATPLEFRVLVPWLIETSVRAGQTGALRLNETFDPHWFAFSGNKHFAHVRIDASVNGWLIPKRDTMVTVWLLEWPAAIEALLELIGVVWTTILVVMLVRQRGHQ